MTHWRSGHGIRTYAADRGFDLRLCQIFSEAIQVFSHGLGVSASVIIHVPDTGENPCGAVTHFLNH